MTEKPTPKFKICVKHNKAFCNSCVIEGMENEIRRLREENERLKEFIDAILSFYGQNLQVYGWHMNGDPEPFDSFIDDNWDDDLETILKR